MHLRTHIAPSPVQTYQIQTLKHCFLIEKPSLLELTERTVVLLGDDEAELRVCAFFQEAVTAARVCHYRGMYEKD